MIGYTRKELRGILGHEPTLFPISAFYGAQALKWLCGSQDFDTDLAAGSTSRAIYSVPAASEISRRCLIISSCTING